MALTDETMRSVRDTLTKNFGSQHKIVIAPCMVEIYLNKTKDLLRSVGNVKWRLHARGVIGLVYDLEKRGQKIRVCLVSPSSAGDIAWQETVVEFTTVRSPHPAFHTFNSTRNLYEQIGILYENKCIARMVFQALSVFTQCPTNDLSRARKNKIPLRSYSFNVAPRPRPHARQTAVERSTVALSNVEVQQAFSTMHSIHSQPLVATVCRRDNDTKESKQSTSGRTSTNYVRKEFRLEPVLENVDMNLNVIPDLCDRLMTTDLCTTEL